MSVPTVVFGGVEGGATHSTVVLLDGEGKLLAEVDGPATNIWLLGLPEAVSRLGKLIDSAKNKAKIPPGSKIRCMCLSLSGAGSEEQSSMLKKEMITVYPALAEEYVICNDTMGPIFTASDSGGVVLIAGTGSNCLLINSDKSQVNCGGWGHMLSDEGSAYWIAHKALKIVFDSEDNLEPVPHNYSTEAIWKAAQSFYKVKERADILPHLYKNFDKSNFAKFCKELSTIAKGGDPLARWLFEIAGRMLAKYMIAISRKAHTSMLKQSGGLPVICVGSVWKSFDLLRPGISKQLDEDCTLKELSLITLKIAAATGAAYIAADYIEYNLPRNYANNFSVFYHYKRN